METIYNPHTQQQQAQGQYMPQQQQYDPQQQQYVPPQEQQQVPPQQQQMAPQQQQYQQQAPPPQPQYVPPQEQQQAPPQQQQQGWPQPQTQGQPPQQQQGWPQPQGQGQGQGQGQQQGHGASPVVKLPCVRKQMERMNLLMMDGYINNIKVTNAPDGTVTRVGFLLAWESFVYENQQQVFNPDGTPAVRDVRFAMTAWGAIAQAMAQLPVGTPISVRASANRWNASRQGDQSNWQTDFRVNRFEVL